MIFRIKSIARHAPAVPRGSGDERISGRVTIGAHRTFQSARGNRELDRHRFILDGPRRVVISGQIGVFKQLRHLFTMAR